MFGLNRLTIKSKLQIMLLVVSLGSISVVGYINWSKTKESLTKRIFEQLTSVRASKAYQVESYFKTVHHHIETLCEDRMVVSAMIEFKQAFAQLNQVSVAQDWDRKIAAYYKKEFLPRLAKNIIGTPVFETYRPISSPSRYLQYHYIANNPNSVGKKYKLEQAEDGSNYSRIHAKYHTLFHNLIKKFNYYDLLLIDSKTGDIIYSVDKETDFGVNLERGSLRTSNLAEVVKKVRANPGRGAVQMVDFQFFKPSYNAPAAFIAGPIYDGNTEVGILAIELSVDEINNELTGNRNWKRDGLGDTGETYLVGADLLMRSVARPLLEDRKSYLNKLRDRNIKNTTIEQVIKLNTSILLKKVNTAVAKKAISGKSGTQKGWNYLGDATLSSYSPVNIPGVNWAIIAEMDITEVYQPIRELQFYFLASTVILVLLVLLYAVIAAQQFVKPIESLIESSLKVKAGELDTEVVFNTKDEFNEIAQVFNDMVQQLRTFSTLLEEKTQENENLLLNILPHSVVERLKKGNIEIADRLQQVTIVCIRIGGLMKITTNDTVEETVKLFDELINTLDESGEKYQLERLSILGDRYLVGCGLTKAQLDHVNRSVEFASLTLNIIKRFNQKHNINLSLQIGIHTGSVMAGIVGKQKFRYQVWGETVDIANQLQQNAKPNTILVTQIVYDRVHEIYDFSKGLVIVQDGYQISTWILGKKELQNFISDDITVGLDFDDDNFTDRKSSQTENNLLG